MPSVCFSDFDMTYYDYDVNRISDSFGRYTRLSDVLEEDSGYYYRFGSMSPYRRRYSSTGSSSSSMDHLWELYPHRLREAGLSRYTDSSSVLTEDTDSFIIGQRVWVGGTKPGTIAFIGDTQFAPGEWAGIALDEAIGKNDGSVAGIRYFQCEPKKGVFSRLTRLSRVPLELPHNNSNDSFSFAPANGVRSPISPTGSTRSLLKSPISQYASNTSLSSASGHVIDYRLGDRVIIKSSQGSKVGTVRYIGYTEFAQGEWVGVELDDPRGKNDGSVEGKRYFACQPNFGLFAPVNKVSKSPSKVKPGACAVHSPGLPPTGMRRAGSKESMTSATSSVRRVRLGVNSLTPQKLPLKTTPMISRPSLQDLVKDKQQHIEQLLKERDLERQEFTKAANQAEEAEQQQQILKKEFEAYRRECEIKLQEHMTLLTELKKDRTDLVGQLEDEKKKNEDLLFKFEEAAIIKSDLEITLEKKTTEFKELQNILELEKAKLGETEKHSNKLFETEENLIKANDEIERLKSTLDNLSLEKKSLGAESTLAMDQIEKLQKELEITKKQLEELNTVRNNLSQELTSINLEHTQTKQKIIELEKQLENSEKQSTQKINDFNELKTEVETSKNLLGITQNQLQELKESKAKDETELTKEIERLKMELSGKSFDLESKTDELKNFQKEIENSSKNNENIIVNYEKKLNESNETYQKKITKLNEDLSKVSEELKHKSEEINKLELSSQETSSTMKSQLEANVKAISEYELSNEALKKEINNLKNFANSSNAELQEQIARQCEESSKKIEHLQSSLSKKEEEFKQLSSDFDATKDNFVKKSDILEKTSSELETLKTSFTSVTGDLAKIKEEKQQFELANGDLKRNIEVLKQNLEDMEKEKKKMQEEIQSLMGSSGDFSIKLEEMHAQVTEKQTLMDKIKQENQEKIQQFEHEIQEKNMKLKEREDEVSKIEKEHKDTKTLLENINKATEQRINELIEENKKAKEDHSVEISKIETVLADKDRCIEQHTKTISDIETKLQQQIEKNQTFVDEIVKNYDDKINTLNVEKERLSKDLETKLKENEEFSNKSKEETDEKLKILADDANKLQNNLSVVTKEKEELTNKLQVLQNEIEEKAKDIECTKNTSQQKLEVLQRKIEEYEKAMQSASNETREKINSLTDTNNNIQKELTMKIQELEQVNTKFQEYVASNEINLSEKEQTYLTKIADLETQVKQKSSNLFEMNTQRVNIEKELQEKCTVIEANKLELEHSLKKIEIAEEKTKLVEKEYTDLKNALDDSKKNVTKEEERNKIINSEMELLVEKCKALEISLKEEKDKNDNLIKENSETGKIVQNECNNLTNKLQVLENNFKEITSQRDCILQALQQMQFTQKQKNELLEKVKVSQNNNLDEIVLNLNDGYVDEPLLNKIKDLEKSLENLRTDLAKEKGNSEKQRAEVTKLKQELNTIQEVGNKVPLKEEVALDNYRNTNNNEKYDYQQLLEEKTLAENQVKFLNSIIVDMQKKNEEQQAKIEILESGYSPAAVQELGVLDYSTSKQLPPRIFCDICDCFDLHETEDCPQQMSEDMPPPPPPNGKKKEKPAPRPYCELCEVFGHDTQDCPEDETF